MPPLFGIKGALKEFIIPRQGGLSDAWTRVF
jgi:hypothetical protein